MRLKIILLFSILLVFLKPAQATHNRAGEIIYEHVSGYTYKVTILTITKSSSPADRPWLKIYWGDEPNNVTESELDSLARAEEEILPGMDAKRNIYYGYHTYAGPGIYTLMMIDPNRNGGVVNIINSVQQVFSIQTQLMISPGLGHNNSVQLLNPPTQEACIYQPWMHNPAAYDPDGDSLSYSLVSCLGDEGLPLSSGDVSAWSLPNEVTASTADIFTINPLTGDVNWNVPLLAGEYNIAIKITEYRQGVAIGFVIRDMQITVVTCNNQPPMIFPVADKCVLAGDNLWFQLVATDPNGDNIEMQAFGGPLTNVVHPATFNPSNYIFTWTPECEEIRYAPYQVTFQATDDGYVNLSYIETMSIQVVAPRVENPVAAPFNNGIQVSWDEHSCSGIFTPYQASLVDYQIYRRNGLYGFVPSNCELGVPEYTGYELIAQVDGVTSTSFLDEAVNFGANYCYMIVTRWPDGSISYASEEVCAQLEKTVPIITQVTIGVTSFDMGVDTVTWSPPADLNTTQYPGPYRYELYHRVAGSNVEELVWSSNTDADFMNLDTAVTQIGNLNTQGASHRYRVRLLSNEIEVGYSSSAMSPWLQLIPLDNAMQIQLAEEVPWDNLRYEYYRKGPLDSDFVLLLDTTVATWTDNNLINNQPYCYKVRTKGTYGTSGVKDPLWNWSQEACAQPYDQEPPCPPVLKAESDCEVPVLTLHWNRPTCADDVTGYRLYRATVEGEPFVLIDETTDNLDTTFTLQPEASNGSIAGCYVVTAVDSLNLWPNGQMNQNESVFSDTLCFDNCPFYALPNMFTPNGDQHNDTYDAFPYRSIDHVEMKVFNRWGTLVYETTDPAIIWNGRDQQTLKLCEDGVYYYTVQVYEIRLAGIIPYSLNGWLHLIDGKVGTVIE